MHITEIDINNQTDRLVEQLKCKKHTTKHILMEAAARWAVEDAKINFTYQKYDITFKYLVDRSFMRATEIIRLFQISSLKKEDDDFWHHTTMKEIKRKISGEDSQYSTITASAIENTVNIYLDSSVRLQELDRLVVDMLMAAELIGIYRAIDERSGALGFVFGSKAVTRKLSECMVHAAKAYQCLDDSPSISARYVRDMAMHAAKNDVVWPNILFVLLDDVEKRGGVL
jgi:hypothetical protein